MKKTMVKYTCGYLLACMQTEEFEMHASTKIIVVTRLATELHAGRQQVHFSILQPFLLTTTVTIAALSATNKLPKVKIHFCTFVICFHLRVSYIVSEVHAAYIFMWLS